MSELQCKNFSESKTHTLHVKVLGKTKYDSYCRTANSFCLNECSFLFIL